MGELTLTGLDEAMLARLSSRAAAHGRSVDEEVAAILAAEVAQQSRTPAVSEEEWLAMAEEARRQTGQPSVSMGDLIREGRDER